MVKRVKTKIKLQVPAGQANPAPPVGPALGQHGLNIMDFCNTFNAQTKDQEGTILPVVITVYEDRSFDFIIKTPPATYLLKKAAGIEKGSGAAGKESAGTISKVEIKKIAELKMKDLNAKDIEQAIKIIEGTARSMGLKVEE